MSNICRLLVTIVTMTKKPRLVVFDLDYTLWPFHVDTHVDPPFSKDRSGEIRDRYGVHVTHFPDSVKILQYFQQESIPVAAASRTGEISGAKQLLKIFEWEKYFVQKEIYPGRKTTHFKKFQDQQGVQYKDMIFFDDEYRNIVDIEKLGVMTVYVPNGISMSIVQKALQDFASR